MCNNLLKALHSMFQKFKTFIIGLIADGIIEINTNHGKMSFNFDFNKLKQRSNQQTLVSAVTA